MRIKKLHSYNQIKNPPHSSPYSSELIRNRKRSGQFCHISLLIQHFFFVIYGFLRIIAGIRGRLQQKERKVGRLVM